MANTKERKGATSSERKGIKRSQRRKLKEVYSSLSGKERRKFHRSEEKMGLRQYVASIAPAPAEPEAAADAPAAE